MKIFGWFLLGCLPLVSLPLAAAESQVDDIEATVTAMARVGASGSATFSPDSKRIALVASLSGTNQVWMVNSQGGWPDQLTSLEGNVGNTLWSPDGKWISFYLVPAQGGGQQIYLIHPDGTGLRRVTDGGDESNFQGGWSSDSRYLMVASNRLGAKSIDSYLYDVERGEFRLVSATPALEELLSMSRDGKHGLLYRQSGRGDDNIFLVDLQTLEERLLTPHTPPATFDNAVFSNDGKTIYMTTNIDRESYALARLQLDAEGRSRPLEILFKEDEAPLEQFALSPDGKTIVLSWNRTGRSDLYFLDLATFKRGERVPLPNDMVNQIRFSPDGQEIAMLVIGSAAPPNVWVYNRDSGKFRQISYSPHPGVDLSRIVSPDLFTFKAHDGLEVSGWLYRPRGAQGRLPLVVIIHGGPDGQERPTFLGTYQKLVQQGIMVFGLNPRGSTGFGKHFTHLDDGPLRANAVRDVKSAVDSLVAKGLADPRNVGVWGWSSGGLLAASAIADYPGTFKAGVLLSALVDLEQFFEKTEPWIASISKTEYGDPAKDAAILRELSPIHKIDTVNIPLLVIHGALDKNVPIEQADRVVESLTRRHVPVKYLKFPDERHGVSELHNRIRYSVEVVKWFYTYLKESAQPAATSQAERVLPE